MTVAWEHWRQPEPMLHTLEYLAVRSIAARLHEELVKPDVQDLIDAVNQPGRSSGEVQAVILEQAQEIGFHSEKRGLFAGYNTPGLRPDYYLGLHDHSTGIILEVERGKTTINNMDLLDFWKAHICASANHLFLLVPQRLQQSLTDERVTRPFDYVRKRLPSFYQPRNYTTVRSCWLFGY